MILKLGWRICCQKTLTQPKPFEAGPETARRRLISGFKYRFTKLQTEGNNEFYFIPIFYLPADRFCFIFFASKKFQWIVTLIASYIFYIYASLPAVLFLIFTTVSTFYTGILMGKANEQYAGILADGINTLTREQRKQYKAENKKKKHQILTVALVVNFASLPL